MTVKTPCYLCGMCEYGYGCEDTPVSKLEPLCFYRLMDLEDKLVDLQQESVFISDEQIDAVTDVVQEWLQP